MAIPHVLGGRDLFGCAQTGTGKTAAFALPILDRLAATAGPQSTGTQRDQRKLRALVLTPTRELAAQIAESFGTYGRHTSLRHAVVYGGVNINRQIQALARGVDVLVATPGRLLDLMHQRAVSLSSIQVLVLDEADRMLDMGFIHDVKRITNTLPRERQTLLFSATIPDNIRALAQSLLSSPVNVAVTPVSSAAETLEQSVYFVEKTDKRRLLVWVLRDDRIDRTLAFTRTKHGANRVAEHLVKSGIPAAAIHGDKSQNARERALDSFKRGQLRVLVATDIAARGIDIDQLSFVINYDLPNTPETYVHRIGRSGRAGASGSALSFCDAEERPYLRGIERLIRSTIPVVGDHPYASGSSAASVADLEAAAPAQRNGGGDRSRNNGGGSRGGQQQHRGRQPQRSNGAEASGAVPIVTQSAPARAVKPGFSAGRGRRY